MELKIHSDSSLNVHTGSDISARPNLELYKVFLKNVNIRIAPKCIPSFSASPIAFLSIFTVKCLVQGFIITKIPDCNTFPFTFYTKIYYLPFCRETFLSFLSFSLRHLFIAKSNVSFLNLSPSIFRAFCT